MFGSLLFGSRIGSNWKDFVQIIQLSHVERQLRKKVYRQYIVMCSMEGVLYCKSNETL